MITADCSPSLDYKLGHWDDEAGSGISFHCVPCYSILAAARWKLWRKKHRLLETAPEKELDTGPEKEDDAPPKGVMADEDPPNGVRVWLKFTPPEPVAEEGC